MKKLLLMFLFMFTLLLVSCGPRKIPASTMVVTPEEVIVNVNSTIKINVSVLPVDATDKILDWEVKDNEIATVTKEGILSGVKVGETTLTIKVKATPSVSRVVNVTVVEEYWPNDEIEEHFGFILPKFPSYTSLKVNHLEDHVLELVIAGYENDIEVLNIYHTLLITDGWIDSTTNDSHMGTYTKTGIDAILTYHNNSSHGQKSIEFKITPRLLGITWIDVNEEVREHFEFELPVFPQFAKLDIKHDANHRLDIIISGINNIEISLHDYLKSLEEEGWIAGEENNHHKGTYTKSDLDIFITYHESHNHEGTLEISINHQTENH